MKKLQKVIDYNMAKKLKKGTRITFLNYPRVEIVDHVKVTPLIVEVYTTTSRSVYYSVPKYPSWLMLA